MKNPKLSLSRSLKKSAEPFLLIPSDPAMKPKKAKHSAIRVKPTKVLTSLKTPAIIKRIIKLRKDGKMTKPKTNNYRQIVAIGLLAAGAALGITNFIGGGLTDAFVASLLVALLFVEAADL